MVARVRSRSLLGTALTLGVLLCAAASASAASTVQPRIIAGGNATAAYQARVDSFLGECGGVIRDSTHVITAGHCASETGVPLPAAALTVHYGSSDTTQQQQVGVSGVTIPSQYQAGDRTYDAALLTLSAPLNGFGSATVNSIPFAGSAAVNAAVAAGGSAFATGWGFTQSNVQSQPQQLQGVNIPLRPDSACSVVFGASYSPERMVCAGGGSAPANNPDTCNGDSGGPLALDVGGSLKLAAITSFGDATCGSQDPAAYTDVDNFEICAVLGGGSACDPVPAPRVVPDTTRPTARVSKVSCRRRRCTFHVRTSDNSGHVASIRMRLYRNVRTCRTVRGRRRCKTVRRSRRLGARRIAGGFSATAKLAAARYRLDAVATDAAHNASGTARRRFRVKKT
jgi:hypothetical protein